MRICFQTGVGIRKGGSRSVTVMSAEEVVILTALSGMCL